MEKISWTDHVRNEEVCGWFEKSVRSQRVGTTGAYRCYFQLVAYLGRTHTKCQPNRLFGVRLNRKSRLISKKWTKKNFVC